MDGSWRLHSVDLRLDKDAQLDYVDNLHVEQLFAPAPGAPWAWIIQSQKLTVNFSALGFKGSGFITAVFSDYNRVVPTYPAPPAPTPSTAANVPTAPPVIAPVTTKELTRQIKREKPDLRGLSKQVRQPGEAGPARLATQRPHLTNEKGRGAISRKGRERARHHLLGPGAPGAADGGGESGLSQKDSSEVIRKSRPYQDSLDRKRNELGVGKVLLTGYTYSNTFAKRTFAVQPIFNELQYNTVEGYVLNAEATFTAAHHRPPLS
ncbi:MAG: DUF5686 family protein [Hymenobacter sp.]